MNKNQISEPICLYNVSISKDDKCVEVCQQINLEAAMHIALFLHQSDTQSHEISVYNTDSGFVEILLRRH